MISSQKSESFAEILQQPKQWYRVVESAVGAHLLNHAVTGHFNLYYWKEGNDEVDFILEKNGKLLALEVKSSHESSTKGMAVFQKMYRPAKVLLIGNAGIPWQEFVLISPETLFKN